MHYTLRILQSCSELGLHAGNLVTYEPEMGTPDCPLFLHRPLPVNVASLLLLLETGRAELVTPHSTVSEFAEAVGYASHPSAHPPGAGTPRRSRRGGHLRLEP